MRIVFAPASHNDFFHIGHIITISIFHKDKVRRHGHDNSAICKYHTGWDIQSICEYSEFISFAVTVCIFTDFDAVIRQSISFFKSVWVIDRFYDPQSSSFVPCHSNWVLDIWLRSKKLNRKINRLLNQLFGFFRCQGILHFRYLISFSEIRNSFIVDRHIRNIQSSDTCFYIFSHCPENAVFHQS